MNSDDKDINSNLVIRGVRNRDLEEISKIEKSSFPTPWPRSMFEVMYSRNSEGFKVAVLDSKIVGYGIIRTEMTMRSGEGIYGKVGHLLDLAVREEYRRKGIGSLLLNELEDFVRNKGVDELWLEVREGNRDAREFYLKNNFEDVGIRRVYYPDGTNAIIMRKKI